MSNYNKIDWDKVMTESRNDLHFNKFKSEMWLMGKKWSEMVEEMRKEETINWKTIRPADPDFIEEDEMIL